MATEPEEDEETGSTAGGWCLLVALGIGAVAVLLAVAPIAGTLLIVTVGGVALWWAISRPNKIHNPSPPPPEPLPSDTKPQFTVVDDPDNPARHRIVWHNKQEA